MRRWIDQKYYLDGLDYLPDVKEKPPRLAQAIVETFVSHDSYLETLGSREHQLKRLKERGLTSINHEPRKEGG